MEVFAGVGYALDSGSVDAEQPSADNPPGPRVGDWWLLGTVVLEGVAIWFVFRAMRRLRDAKLHGAGGRR